MYKRLITGIPFIVLGILIAIGPITIFPVCEIRDVIMKCHWTARAELGVGLSIAVLGILTLFFESKIFGLSAGVFINGILVLLFPTVLIGVCAHPRASCHMLALPALLVLGSITIVVAALNGFFVLKKSGLFKKGSGL
ncbi:DUF4418 family protein [Treponema primitia]|uniref:DUF4418 family protein n=1 Tax=Treponema primitia TaxID=88058 RepID=UPI0002555823|nr:DUF4418 family protein [Treponema primitia]